ncbi:putative ubiquitin related modifier 1 [Blattamonas nauphoetae]|uniref:Ubiquitin-related modifier 1 homolog n=1 Tax=Blattamonas nauphoetae TaxID=2049346 RepID=A0ABQ9XCP8_9EUKA|nr:putative ubiquitin related modifier 1 [Blattamonas nauphoetae]
MKLTLTLHAGLESLFNQQKKLELALDDSITPVSLIPWIRDNLLSGDPKQQLVVDDAIRPGILYMINDADWTLVDADSPLNDGDEIALISTIHGG